MKNYTEIELSKIDRDIKEYIQIIDNGINWGERNLKHDDQSNLFLTLKTSKKVLSKISSTLINKPAIALFGASQVGKSYLIKNLLSIEGKPFIIENNGIDYDFLKEINPPGVGAESTGVVTRFTKDDDKIFENFPIKVKLLNPKDIILIICDSFFLDSKKITSYPGILQFDDFLKKLEEGLNKDINQTVLTEFDILDCKEYFDLHFYKNALLLESVSKTRFFERIGRIISHYNYNEWPSVFSILWNNNICFTELFTDLIEHLNVLSYDNIIYLGFDSVLREHIEILDVQRLNELNTNKKEILVKKKNGEELYVNLSYVSALISELIFKVPENILDEKKFLNNSDLLDFPGARSRLSLEISDMNIDLKPHLLLRGKVSYLFNKYCDEFNINNLLFCINDKQLEVNELPSLLYNWIERNIGHNENERSLTLLNNQIDPLFVVFTFFNNQLKYDSTNDHDYSDYTKLNYKWDNRFNRFFQNEIVTQNKGWHKKWTNEKKMFSNLYLLRDYKYSNDTFYGFEEEEKELSVAASRENYYQALKKSFLDFDFVKDHFSNPEISWQNSATVQNDGTKLIIENLNYVSNNFSKVRNYENKIAFEIDKVKSLLKQYAHTDNLSEQRKVSFRKSSDLQFSLINYFSKDKRNFVELLGCFYIKPTDIYNVLNENIVSVKNSGPTESSTSTKLLISQFPALENVKSYNDIIQILQTGLFIDSAEEVERFLKDKEVSVDQLINSDEERSLAASLVDLIYEKWEKKCISNYAKINHGITEVQFDFLFSHYKKLYILRGIKTQLTAVFTAVLNEIESNRGSEEFLAEVYAAVINYMVNNFDINILTKDMLSEIEVISKLYNLDFKFLESGNKNKSFDLSQFFEDDSSASLNLVVNKYSTWINKFKISVMASCGFVDYDEFANNEIKAIITNINPYQAN